MFGFPSCSEGTTIHTVSQYTNIPIYSKNVGIFYARDDYGQEWRVLIVGSIPGLSDLSGSLQCIICRLGIRDYLKV